MGKKKAEIQPTPELETGAGEVGEAGEAGEVGEAGEARGRGRGMGGHTSEMATQ